MDHKRYMFHTRSAQYAQYGGMRGEESASGGKFPPGHWGPGFTDGMDEERLKGWGATV